VQSAAGTATSELTVFLKEEIDRERPDSSDQRSFPSGHSSAAFAYSALAWRNVDEIHMPYAVRVPIRIALIALPVGTAWARIEAGKHFPSDVLAGAAVGNFFASFFNGTFLETHEELRVQAWGDPSTGEWMVGLGWSF
jgi:membrane-associated phospholipid phosphatase